MEANLDFSCVALSCKSLSVKYDEKHIIQLLYHAAMPTQKNAIIEDKDIKMLFDSELFKKIVNRFHRVGECGEYTGVKK